VSSEERDLVGVGIESEGPLQNGPAAALVSNGREVGQAADAVGDAAGFFGNQFGGEFAVTECRGEEDVWRRATIEEIASDLGSFADAPLGGSGIVVVIAGVDVSAVIQKELGGADVAREMKGVQPSPAFAWA